MSIQALKHYTNLIVDEEDEDLLEYLTSPSKEGYARIILNGKMKRLHRVIAERFLGECPLGCVVDHKDRNTQNNSRGNLRHLTNAGNCQNSGKQWNNTTGSIGVDQHQNKWRARIQVDSKRVHLGCFNTRELAAEAYVIARAIYWDVIPT